MSLYFSNSYLKMFDTYSNKKLQNKKYNDHFGICKNRYLLLIVYLTHSFYSGCLQQNQTVFISKFNKHLLNKFNAHRTFLKIKSVNIDSSAVQGNYSKFFTPIKLSPLKEFLCFTLN